jgi:hypothetical protein
MRILVAVILALCTAACSSGPIVDMKGVDQERYEQDLAECRQYPPMIFSQPKISSIRLRFFWLRV